ncbi:uncharacterized protein LOC144714662 [Wolffia australiana]
MGDIDPNNTEDMDETLDDHYHGDEEFAIKYEEPDGQIGYIQITVPRTTPTLAPRVMDRSLANIAVDQPSASMMQPPPLVAPPVRPAPVEPRPDPMADASLRTLIFYTYVKINGKVCKLIVDSGSCINAISDAIVLRLGLTPIPHPTPYYVLWIDASSLPVKSKCRVPLKVSAYDENVLCDVLPMKVGSIILGRTTGHLAPVYDEPANKPVPTKPIGLMVVRGPLFARDLGCEGDDTPLCVAVTLDVSADPPIEPRAPEVEAILLEFGDVFPEELPRKLPPMRSIQHAIDLVPGASLPNLPHYCMEPQRYEELLRQVCELLAKGLIQESLSPCAVPALLALKKDGTWRMCCDSRAINKITLYAHPKKCSFLTPEVSFLRFIVIAQGVAADPDKVRAITSWPSPASLHDVQSFIGLATFYQQFAPVLRLLDFGKVFEVTCDASGVGIGGARSQEGHPVEFFSEKLNDHKKGKDNVVADALSRRAHMLNIMRVKVLGFETIRDGYDSCPDFVPIITRVRQGPSRDYRDYVLTDDYLFYQNRLCVPRTSLRDFLICKCHVGGLSGHFRREKTISTVEYQFYWPSLKRDISNIITQCRLWALAKQGASPTILPLTRLDARTFPAMGEFACRDQPR